MGNRKRFRRAAFGKRIEYWIVGLMLKEGLDVYVPLVADQAVDAIVRRSDGSIALVQIKARSKDVVEGDAALFAAIPHDITPRENYWFVFYSERMDTMWLMTSAEFIAGCVRNKSGENTGLCSIWFNGTRRNRNTGQRRVHEGTIHSVHREGLRETRRRGGTLRLMVERNLRQVLLEFLDTNVFFPVLRARPDGMTTSQRRLLKRVQSSVSTTRLKYYEQ